MLVETASFRLGSPAFDKTLSDRTLSVSLVFDRESHKARAILEIDFFDSGGGTFSFFFLKNFEAQKPSVKQSLSRP